MSDEYEGNKRREMLWEQMRGNLPPKSTDEVWAEHLRLQKQHISELEEENGRLNQRIKRLEEALTWYESKAEDCNRHGSEGVAARDALANDLGRKAKEAKL